jgi:hypothetical protein
MSVAMASRSPADGLLPLDMEAPETPPEAEGEEEANNAEAEERVSAFAAFWGQLECWWKVTIIVVLALIVVLTALGIAGFLTGDGETPVETPCPSPSPSPSLSPSESAMESKNESSTTSETQRATATRSPTPTRWQRVQ